MPSQRRKPSTVLPNRPVHADSGQKAGERRPAVADVEQPHKEQVGPARGNHGSEHESLPVLHAAGPSLPVEIDCDLNQEPPAVSQGTDHEVGAADLGQYDDPYGDYEDPYADFHISSFDAFVGLCAGAAVGGGLWIIAWAIWHAWHHT